MEAHPPYLLPEGLYPSGLPTPRNDGFEIYASASWGFTPLDSLVLI